jgi:bla regulator protein blaR1
MTKTVAAIALTALAAIAQTPTMPKAFDVAAIKPNSSSDNRVMLNMPGGGRFIATGVNTRLLIQQAYNVRDFQISGGPGWMATDRWDINAQAEGMPDRMPPGALAPMLQSLLEDRFQLKAHRETKEMSIYAIQIAKGGPKIKENSGEPGPRIGMGRGHLSVKKGTLQMLATQLSNQTGRVVVDQTGLKGDYDFELDWTPDLGQGGGPFGPFPEGPGAPPPPNPNGPTLFTAIQEQLGLRLESTKGPVETIVIDRIEKPSDN